MASSGACSSAAFIVGAGAIIHALVVLSTHWSVAVDAALTCREISPRKPPARPRGAPAGVRCASPTNQPPTNRSPPPPPPPPPAAAAAAAAASCRPLAVSVATPPGDTLPGEDGAPAADWSRTQLSFESAEASCTG